MLHTVAMPPDVKPRRADAFRVASNAELGGGNPYLDLFHGALAAHAIEFAGTFEPTSRWLRENHERVEALHFHWPEFLLRRAPEWARWVDGRLTERHSL